jgi:two-component system chemotaxis response regulator CheY
MNSLSIRDLSILIVEPSMTSARFIEVQMKSLNVRDLKFCSSGAEALEQLRNHPVDLVASSMYLPDMTATELLTTMRNDEQLENISFMLISTETSFSRLDPLRQAGIIAILPKPFSNEDLHRALVATTRLIDTTSQGTGPDEFNELRTLVVDDSPLARKHIIRILRSLGIEKITEAEDGREAVGLLQRYLYDLIFTDYNMPEMDGEKLTRYIRTNSMQPDIPVLMVTSEENENRLAAVQQAGVSAICDKPFDTDTVMQLIRNIHYDRPQ